MVSFYRADRSNLGTAFTAARCNHDIAIGPCAKKQFYGAVATRRTSSGVKGMMEEFAGFQTIGRLDALFRTLFYYCPVNRDGPSTAACQPPYGCQPVCGELVILTKDRAAVQTCGTVGTG